MESSDDTNIIGPLLPTHLKRRNCQIGPALPPHLSSKLDCSEINYEEECSSIGPQLPPHLQKRRHSQGESDITEKELHIGPQLPLQAGKSSIYVGPQLPPHLQNKSEYLEDKEHIHAGPQLPPQQLPEENSGIYGPQLPPHLLNNLSAKPNSSQDEDKPSKTVGPQLPPHLRKQLEIEAENSQESEEVDDSAYGPMPVGISNISAAEIALEERAIQMQIDKLTPQSKEPVREEWMTELPEARARSLGLGSRQFRKNAAPDMSDRSSWTTVAGEKPKEKKKDNLEDLRAEAEQKQQEKRDKEQALEAKKHKRKSKSLVEMHQEKIKRKDAGMSSNERRPFSRDVDLQVNKFDDAQKKAIMKKAQLLDDRFSSGKSKFL
ncbi:GPALPP motifs-containing protein 1 [Anthonomus grandis grandis]|uniref:GPALPP motifs-containing protein 1 n=1 Tax=Anthonomus grandis grandis TaxID=2921223 RepID=UPI002165B3BB|nr:GPALPP motifs-containing protein 1 [Anthonomus grandis grandis]XP_050307468.1 GPALPP motifs-containing protein 1 [Anthonomus grandis grandis]